MPSPYSDDLREKASACVDRADKKSHVCQMLKISRNTLDLWPKARAKTGSFKAKRNYSRGAAPKIPNLEEFRQFAQKNGDRTQKLIFLPADSPDLNKIEKFWPRLKHKHYLRKTLHQFDSLQDAIDHAFRALS